MRSRPAISGIVALFLFAAAITYSDGAQKSKPRTVTDAQIKKAIIQESIQNYPGNCPCPYNTASNGSRCGKRSAWSRAGGYAPLCYDTDVTKDMVREWRERNKNPSPSAE